MHLLYGCEIWSLKLREGYKLQVCRNEAAKKIYENRSRIFITR
jgi:hypothetical protein